MPTVEKRSGATDSTIDACPESSVLPLLEKSIGELGIRVGSTKGFRQNTHAAVPAPNSTHRRRWPDILLANVSLNLKVACSSAISADPLETVDPRLLHFPRTIEPLSEEGLLDEAADRHPQCSLAVETSVCLSIRNEWFPPKLWENDAALSSFYRRSHRTWRCCYRPQSSHRQAPLLQQLDKHAYGTL